MPRSLLSRYTISFPFIYLLLSKCVNFAVTTTTLDHPTAKLAFIFEEIQKEDLGSTFDNILKEAIIFFASSLGRNYNHMESKRYS